MAWKESWDLVGKERHKPHSSREPIESNVYLITHFPFNDLDALRKDPKACKELETAQKVFQRYSCGKLDVFGNERKSLLHIEESCNEPSKEHPAIVGCTGKSSKPRYEEQFAFEVEESV